MAELTPMMQQYRSIKEQYSDTILFFRMGDFYEMFGEDAKTAAKILDLALTSRNKGGGEKIPMAGVPAHSADSYIANLIENDFKVAICEQLEDPDEASGLVERDVIRIITPGTVIENEILNEKENNYLAAAITDSGKIGFSYIDISTGEFYVTEFADELEEKIWDEIDRIHPREVILDQYFTDKEKFQILQRQLKFVENKSKKLNYESAYRQLINHFQTHSLSGFGCAEMKSGILAAGQILKFLEETQKRALAHINKISTYNLNEFMVLDSATRRNLELTSTIRDNKREGSLLNIIDVTITSMGGRLIKKWINQPLIEKEQIKLRLNAVEELVNNYLLLQKLRECLHGIYDLERILGKITYESANARDLASLKLSLDKLPGLKANLKNLESKLFKNMKDNFDPLTDLRTLLDKAIVEEPPVSVREGGLIKENYNEKLDELRTSCKQGKDWISNLQKKERERTGINSLKVGFNKVFGYYIEVTNSNLDKVPDEYTRKQTLTNSERYIIPELKEKEAQVLGAEEKINDLEYELFVDVRNEIGENVNRVKNTADIISKIDVLLSLALVAIENDYNKPDIKNDNLIDIKEGRHPVVEKMQNQVFVPNDTYLDNKDNRFIIITGPNMSGKSTYMRQVALIVLLAQIGSFVPAAHARIGIVDRIFTRVGASDDLTTGQSTFMIEMNEVANIVNNATNKSLVILDEVGRGTSTYDGVSIAWAVSEYINDPGKIGARTLFATHYHELTGLEDKFAGIKNYNVLVKEDDNGVHFLHKIVPGQANQSYGIEVARLAGLPQELIINAEQVLYHLEESNKRELKSINEIAADKENHTTSVNENFDKAKDQTPMITDNGDKKENTVQKNKSDKNNVQQLPLFKTNYPVLDKLQKKDLLNMTPMEAMNFLYELQQELKEEEEYG